MLKLVSEKRAWLMVRVRYKVAVIVPEIMCLARLGTEEAGPQRILVPPLLLCFHSFKQSCSASLPTCGIQKTPHRGGIKSSE